MKNKGIVAAGLAAVVLIFVAVAFMYKSNESSSVSKYTDFNSEPFVRAHSTTFGENKKNVTVVEFLDPQCGACAFFHTAIKTMYKEYYEDIKLVIRYLPNHKNSLFTVELLEAAKKQNKYNEVLETIFDTQDKWAAHNNEKPELLWDFLEKVEGLNMDQLKADMETLSLREQLVIDRQDAKTLNVRGTPTIFVNGEKLESLSAQALMDLVESKLYK